MGKRSFERMPANISTLMLYGNILYSGTVLNLSEKGMFVSSKVHFPSDTMLAISISEGIIISASVKWVQKTSSRYSIGVELLYPSKEYLKLVESFRVG